MARCLFHKSTISAPGLFLGALRSSVAPEPGWSPACPERHWRRTYEMDIQAVAAQPGA